MVMTRSETGTAQPARGVGDLIERWVRRTPDALAVRDAATGQELTYAQLWRASAGLAGELVDAGVGPGQFVATSIGRSVDLVVAMLGIVRAGAAYLPLDHHAPAGRRAGMVREAGARALVVPTHAMSTSDVPGTADLGGLRQVAVAPDLWAGDGAWLPAGPGGDDPIYLMYTSGSTGRPKGVVVPHRAVVRLVVDPSYATIEPADRIAHSSNPAFDASTFEIWGPLAAGATVVVFPSLTDIGIEDWAELADRERITVMFLTTALFNGVARERPDAFGPLRALLVGGEQMELAAVRRVMAAGPPGRLVNVYGPTETTTFAASFDCTEDSIAGRDRIPIGYPLQQTTLSVLDDELSAVPVGGTGELCIGGPGVALGYLNRPDLTAQRFVADSRLGLLYRTGDVAREHPDGTVELLGRRDRQVKLRGFRIELEEIERAATGTGLVDAAFVEKVGEGPAAVLVGFVLPAAGATRPGLGGELSGRLARQLPTYMIPSHWLVLDRLPLGPTGKVDRRRLPALLDRPAAGDPPGSGAGPLADWVRALCRDVLGSAQVSDSDNFLDLGGNSITAAQLAARISDRLRVAVEPADILLADSLAELAARLHDLAGDTVDTVP